MTITCIIHNKTGTRGSPGAYLISPKNKPHVKIWVPESVVTYFHVPGRIKEADEFGGTYPKHADRFEIEGWWARKNADKLEAFGA